MSVFGEPILGFLKVHEYSYFLSDILLITGIFYMGFMYYTYISIEAEIESFRKGKKIDYLIK